MELFRDIATQGADEMNGYFSQISRAYGHSECLDTALRALLVTAKARLSPGSRGVSQAEISYKYGRALRSLQEAINSQAWQRPEVLCSTQLLALVEVRDKTKRSGELLFLGD